MHLLHFFFDANKNNVNPQPFVENSINGFDNLRDQNNFLTSSLEIYKKTIDLEIEWNCNLVAGHPQNIKFLKLLGYSDLLDKKEFCWKLRNGLIPHKEFLQNIKNNKFSILEIIIWKLVIFLNFEEKSDILPNLKEINTLDETEKLFLSYFIRDELLKYTFYPTQNNQKTYALFEKYFPNRKTDLYSIALLNNCSSFSTKTILNAQEKVFF